MVQVIVRRGTWEEYTSFVDKCDDCGKLIEEADLDSWHFSQDIGKLIASAVCPECWKRRSRLL